MPFRNVESLEVVPSRFNFGAFGNCETHAYEDIFESVAGLGDKMKRAAPCLLAEFREIEPFSLKLASSSGLG